MLQDGLGREVTRTGWTSHPRVRRQQQKDRRTRRTIVFVLLLFPSSSDITHGVMLSQRETKTWCVQRVSSDVLG